MNDSDKDPDLTFVFSLKYLAGILFQLFFFIADQDKLTDAYRKH